jgi:hypothetical protein
MHYNFGLDTKFNNIIKTFLRNNAVVEGIIGNGFDN